MAGINLLHQRHGFSYDRRFRVVVLFCQGLEHVEAFPIFEAVADCLYPVFS